MKKAIYIALGITGLVLCGIPAEAKSGDVLYNGIQLPEQWPPRYAEPDSAALMPVPYLENKPSVIPVNVGRQLFVDNFLISETNLNL